MEQAAITETVSFWGGVASIIALLVAIFGGFLWLYRRGQAARDREFKNLESIANSIAERTKKATTQGKRVDLYIYYESLFSQLRYSQLIWEIQITAFHIICAMLFLTSANVLPSGSLSSSTTLETWIHANPWASRTLFAMYLIIFNLLMRIRINSQRRRLNALWLGFIKQLEGIVL